MSAEENKKKTLPELEEEILKFWEKNKIFERSVKQRAKKPRFVFYDGPPFATGLPHYGHILASTIKDVVPRYWAMKGYLVERRWGWDCHGLPIENLVEHDLKISGRKEIEKLGLKKFNETARAKVLTYADEWKETVRRIGRFVDFENSYKTMDPEYMESVWWAFSRLYKKGLVYKDSRVSLFCPRCETPLSNFEVAMDNSYRDREDDSVFVKLSIEGRHNEFLLIWTTTPWTLPGNAAVAVNPEIEYTKFKIVSENGARSEFIWSANISSREPDEEVSSVEKKFGRELIGLKYSPIFRLTKDADAYKIIGADFVDISEGTGLVHIAPAFGEEDFLLGKKEKLPLLETLDDTGKFSAKYKGLEFILGKTAGEANQAVIDYLRSRGILWKTQKITHRYPICWRCQTPLIFKVQPAWFIKISALKEKMLRENEKIDWHPEHLKNGRFGKGIEDAPDWNVSRSRFWGTPMPVWECKKCGKAEVVGGREELQKKTDSAKNKYIIMRHGESLSNARGVTAEKNGDAFPLTAKGRKQVEKTARALKNESVDLIFSSPVLRTKETAGIVAEYLGIRETHFDERLREIRFGVMEGLSSNAYANFFSSRQDRFSQKPEGGENLREVRKRVFSLLEELEQKYQGKTILIISHEYPMWMFYASAQGMSFKETLALRDEPALQNDFVKTAEAREVIYKNAPRNDLGELDFHRPYADEIETNCDCGGKAKRIPDVFDCWFESGSMPFAEKHYPFENKMIFEKNFPADFISEYIAQTRGWFYTMHALSVALFSKLAFRHVVTTGTILSEKGEKLSKSRQNFPDPRLLFEKYGVDAMRFYLMSSPVMLADNINFSEKDVDETYKKYSLIIQNVLNFYRLYEYKLKGRKISVGGSKNVLDRWIVSRLQSVIREVTQGFDDYEITKAVRPLADFVQDISLWYVRRSRERIKQDSADAKIALITLQKILREFAILTAPITPFLAEIVYKAVGKGVKMSVHLENWPKFSKKLQDKGLESDMSAVREIVSESLRLRAEAKIKIRQPLAKLQITDRKLQKSPAFKDLIKDEINVKEITFGDKLALDTNITAELKEEGVVREFVRNIQDLRKNLGMKPRQTVICQISGDKTVEELILKWKQNILCSINAKDLKIGGGKTFRAEKEIILDGQKILVWIK